MTGQVPAGFVAVMCGGNRIPTPRLAEKYRECLTSKEKILKEIEVKKEYLSSLQPRLNSIMQVQQHLCKEGEKAFGAELRSRSEGCVREVQRLG